MDSDRFIISAALRWQGMILSVPKPGRHPDIMRALGKTIQVIQPAVTDGALLELPVLPNDQGFIDSDGKFVGREEAMHIAREAGQLKPNIRDAKHPMKELFSEDVW